MARVAPIVVEAADEVLYAAGGNMYADGQSQSSIERKTPDKKWKLLPIKSNDFTSLGFLFFPTSKFPVEAKSAGLKNEIYIFGGNSQNLYLTDLDFALNNVANINLEVRSKFSEQVSPVVHKENIILISDKKYKNPLIDWQE